MPRPRRFLLYYGKAALSTAKDFWLRFIGEKVSLSIFCSTNAKETKFFVLSFGKTGEKFRRILTFTGDLCYNVRRNQAKVESSFRFGRREVRHSD